jgi:hypothetical protein
MKARENPLRTERVLQLRFRLEAIEAGLTWETLLARLEKLGFRGSIVGPEGSGKTTLLEDLAPHFQAHGLRLKWLRLSREKQHFTSEEWTQIETLSSDEIVLFDGAEQLSRHEWKRFERFSRWSAGLVVTSHRTGLLATLIQCRTTPQLLRELLDELLEKDGARWHGACGELWERHDGNLRHVLRELYDVYANEPPAHGAG